MRSPTLAGRQGALAVSQSFPARTAAARVAISVKRKKALLATRTRFGPSTRNLDLILLRKPRAGDISAR